MKNIITLAAFLLSALPLLAEPAEMNLYLKFWPQGEENAPTATQVVEFEAGGVRIFTHATPEAEADKMLPATPEEVALLTAAVAAVLRTISLDMGKPITGDSIAVEWSISNATTFERGSVQMAPDALPPEVLDLQDALFGARLAP